MREKYAYGAMLAALLFVGAGCATSGSLDTTADVDTETESMRKEDDDTIDAKIESGAEADVDATVDLILKDAEDEKKQQAETEKDADDATSDSAELNALIQADYEVK